MKCPFCAEKIKKEAILCRFCGRSLTSTIDSDDKTVTDDSILPSPSISIEESETILESTSQKHQWFSGKKRIAIVTASGLLISAIGIGGYQINSQIQENKRIEAQRIAKAKAAADAARKVREAEAAERAEFLRALEDDSWVPKGFTKFALNPYLAYKKDNSQNCTLDTCFPFEVVTAKYCSSIYIEGNSGRNGVIYDWSNDTAQGVSPGTRVKMKLEYSHDGENTSTTFTEVNCRDW